MNETKPNKGGVRSRHGERTKPMRIPLAKLDAVREWLDATAPETLGPVSPRSARRIWLLSERVDTDVTTLLDMVTSGLATKYLPLGEDLPIDPATIDRPQSWA